VIRIFSDNPLNLHITLQTSPCHGFGFMPFPFGSGNGEQRSCHGPPLLRGISYTGKKAAKSVGNGWERSLPPRAAASPPLATSSPPALPARARPRAQQEAIRRARGGWGWNSGRGEGWEANLGPFLFWARSIRLLSDFHPGCFNPPGMGLGMGHSEATEQDRTIESNIRIMIGVVQHMISGMTNINK
jgi:hypothetical protein